MPELPDVEGFRRVLLQHAVGERIADIEVRDAGVIRERSAEDFVRALRGRVFAEPARVGKWLMAPTDGPMLLAHFGMTGRLVWAGPDEEHGFDREHGSDPEDRYDRVLFDMGTGRLIYRDQRKLRGLWLAETDEEIAAVLGRQGPDALGLTGARLTERLQGHRRSLKAALMDQSVIAGLGNMLSDEVLWRARIHPARQFAALDAAERRRLDRSLQTVLRTSVKDASIPRSKGWLSSERHVGGRCPRCHGELRTSRLGRADVLLVPGLPARVAARPAQRGRQVKGGGTVMPRGWSARTKWARQSASDFTGHGGGARPDLRAASTARQTESADGEQDEAPPSINL